MSTPKVYRIPDTQLPRVREINQAYQDIRDRAKQATAEYESTLAKLRYEADTLTKSVSREMCNLCGVPYSESDGHMLDTLYVDLGAAYFQVVLSQKSGAARDEEMVASFFGAQSPSKLN